MSDVVVVALIGAVPATLAAGASAINILKSRRIEHQVTPSNGTPTAAMIEALQKDLRGVKDDLQYHVTVQHGRGPVDDNKKE